MNRKTIELLEKSLSAEPANWELRLHIAQLRCELGELDSAVGILNAGGEIPEDEAVRLGVAEILGTAESHRNAAMTILDSVLSTNKACAAAYLLKARFLHERGLLDEALKNYNVATVIDESLEDETFAASLLAQPNTLSTGQDSSGESLAAAEASPHPEGGIDSIDVETSRAVDALLQEVWEESEGTDAVPALPGISFSDIGGMEELKERLRMAIVYPMKNRELFAKFKSGSGGGVLLYGPPGCGKTLVSRAAAGESGTHFQCVSIHEILSKWIGESEQRMHQIFEVARRRTPAIVFIDEVDALGIKRSDAGNSASLVNTLLTEIDGATSNNDEILVIGATNTPWRIDPAFRRPGRFDHVIFVPPPDEAARAAIFEIALEGIPCEDIDLMKMARETKQFSGADIHAVVKRASEVVLRAIMTSGKEQVLRKKDILQAIKKSRPTTLEWLEQAANYASFQNQSGLYDDLAEYLQQQS